MVDDISHEGLRVLLRQAGVSFQRLRTWKASKDPQYAARKARMEQLCTRSPTGRPHRGTATRRSFSALTSSGRSACSRARAGSEPPVSGKNKEPGREPRPRMRATYTRTAGVRHLFAAHELGEDKVLGRVKPRKTRARFLEFCRYLRSLYPACTRIAIVCDNFSPHLSTRKDRRVGTWATANNVQIAYTPTNSSWLNRIEAQFTALRYFALDGTDHATHQEQASMIRRYIIWRNNHAHDERLRRIVDRANVA